MSSITEMGLDDIKKADEIINMAVLGSKCELNNGPPSPPPTQPRKRPKFFSSLSPNAKKTLKKPQRQFSNVFPCPLISSVDLDSPEGSVSSLGLVNSAPFASLAMTSVHARRARQTYRTSRPSSVQSAQHVMLSSNGNLVSNGRLGGGMSVPTVNKHNYQRSVLPRQSSLPAAPASLGVHYGCSGSNRYFLDSSFNHLSSSASKLASRSKSPMALSINEEGDEETLEANLEIENAANEAQQLQQQERPRSNHGLCHQPSSRAHRLRRQVTICEDTMSIADSIYNMRIHPRSKQNSLSIQSGMHSAGLRNSPSPVKPVSYNGDLKQPPHLVLEEAATTAAAPTSSNPIEETTKLLRQESSFTQEEIYSLQEAFAQLDLDGDGRLSRKEVEKAMGNVLSEADLKDLLEDLDTDQNGEVEWHEFLAVMKTRMREPESVKMLKEAFRVIVADTSDGVMTADQMKRCLLLEMKSSCADLELDEMLATLDSDNDGKIQMDDFVKLLATDSISVKDDDTFNCVEYCAIL